VWYNNRYYTKGWLSFLFKPFVFTAVSYLIIFIINIVLYLLFFNDITYWVFMLGVLTYNFVYIIRNMMYTREFTFSDYTILGMSVKAIFPIYVFILTSLITLQWLLWYE